MNKDPNDAFQRLVFSPRCACKGGYVYLSLVASLGGGVHAKEEFDLWIRVFSRQMIGNFVLSFIVKICSSLMFRLDLYLGTSCRKVESRTF